MSETERREIERRDEERRDDAAAARFRDNIASTLQTLSNLIGNVSLSTGEQFNLIDGSALQNVLESRDFSPSAGTGSKSVTLNIRGNIDLDSLYVVIRWSFSRSSTDNRGPNVTHTTAPFSAWQQWGATPASGDANVFIHPSLFSKKEKYFSFEPLGLLSDVRMTWNGASPVNIVPPANFENTHAVTLKNFFGYDNDNLDTPSWHSFPSRILNDDSFLHDNKRDSVLTAAFPMDTPTSGSDSAQIYESRIKIKDVLNQQGLHTYINDQIVINITIPSGDDLIKQCFHSNPSATYVAADFPTTSSVAILRTVLEYQYLPEGSSYSVLYDQISLALPNVIFPYTRVFWDALNQANTVARTVTYNLALSTNVPRYAMLYQLRHRAYIDLGTIYGNSLKKSLGHTQNFIPFPGNTTLRAHIQGRQNYSTTLEAGESDFRTYVNYRKLFRANRIHHYDELSYEVFNQLFPCIIIEFEDFGQGLFNFSSQAGTVNVILEASLPASDAAFDDTSYQWHLSLITQDSLATPSAGRTLNQSLNPAITPKSSLTGGIETYRQAANNVLRNPTLLQRISNFVS